MLKKKNIAKLCLGLALQFWLDRPMLLALGRLCGSCRWPSSQLRGQQADQVRVKVRKQLAVEVLSDVGLRCPVVRGRRGSRQLCATHHIITSECLAFRPTGSSNAEPVYAARSRKKRTPDYSRNACARTEAVVALLHQPLHQHHRRLERHHVVLHSVDQQQRVG